MKSTHFKIIIGILFLSLISTSADAQEFPRLDTSPMDISIARNTDMSPMVRVIYSRPQKRNRVIFGDLVPFGEVWRTGANEATELEIYESLLVGNVLVPPGTYTLYTIPNKEVWTVIINCDINAWGAFSYDETMDFLRIQVKSKKAAATIESLSMAFKPNSDGVSLMIGWDDRFIEVPFKKVK
jgi:hypothetical protein